MLFILTSNEHILTESWLQIMEVAITSVGMSVQDTALTMFIILPSSNECKGCNVSPSPTDVSPTENSWMLHPLDKVSLGYFAPDRTIPSLNSDLIERSDTRLPIQLSCALALRSSGVLCVGRACIRRRGANPINLVRGVGEAGQTPH